MTKKSKLKFWKSIPLMFIFNLNGLCTTSIANPIPFETLKVKGKKTNSGFTNQLRRNKK